MLPTICGWDSLFREDLEFHQESKPISNGDSGKYRVCMYGKRYTIAVDLALWVYENIGRSLYQSLRHEESYHCKNGAS